jgi:FkbM family methyltransferase
MKTYNYLNNPEFPIKISENTLRLTPHTFFSDLTMWEADSLKYFFDSISKNEKYNIVDIGAQSGLYSLFAKYMPLCEFYAFEPFIETYNLLVENLQINEISNVKTYNIGISDKEGSAVLNTSASHNGLHTIGQPKRFSDVKSVDIKVDTIDNIFYETNTPIHFMKIDTEGWEYNILKGAEKTIKTFKPLIQLEWNETNMEQCGINPQDLLDLISEFDYIEHCKINEELFIKPLVKEWV